MTPKPIYTPDNTTCAFQLLHAVSIFWKDPGPGDHWLNDLKPGCESAGIRILQHRLATSTCSQFLVSTRPDVCGTYIVRGIKGRLQTLVREHRPRPFQRNYDLHSIGSTTRDKTENYVAGQLKHHDVNRRDFPGCRLVDLQWINPDVDLQGYRFTSHGRYRCNVHLSFRFQEPVLPLEDGILEQVRSAIRKTATKHGHWLSRIGLLADHLHIVLGIEPKMTPGEVSLSYMNNVAWACGMQSVLWHSFYVGTIGEYDLGVTIEPEK